jgi:hypothetical protein
MLITQIEHNNAFKKISYLPVTKLPVTGSFSPFNSLLRIICTNISGRQTIYYTLHFRFSYPELCRRIGISGRILNHILLYCNITRLKIGCVKLNLMKGSLMYVYMLSIGLNYPGRFCDRRKRCCAFGGTSSMWYSSCPRAPCESCGQVGTNSIHLSFGSLPRSTSDLGLNRNDQLEQNVMTKKEIE